MRPITTPPQTATGISDPVEVDYLQMDFKIGLSLNITGTSTSSVQFSLDDPHALYSTNYNTNGRWHNITNLAAVSALAFAVHEVPCRALRVNVTSFTSGAVSLTIVQGHH